MIKIEGVAVSGTPDERDFSGLEGGDGPQAVDDVRAVVSWYSPLSSRKGDTGINSHTAPHELAIRSTGRTQNDSVTSAAQGLVPELVECASPVYEVLNLSVGLLVIACDAQQVLFVVGRYHLSR